MQFLVLGVSSMNGKYTPFYALPDAWMINENICQIKERRSFVYELV